MTYATGRRWCLKRGYCRAVRLSAELEWCPDCGRARNPLFTDEEVDRYDARDANRAELEATGNPTDNEADANRGRPEL